MVNVKEAAPESEEKKIRQKCAELRKRITETEESNEIALLALSRTRTSIRRLRLQHALLLERLQSSIPEDGSDFLVQPPPPSLLRDSVNIKKLLSRNVSKSNESNHSNVVTESENTASINNPELCKIKENANLQSDPVNQGAERRSEHAGENVSTFASRGEKDSSAQHIQRIEEKPSHGQDPEGTALLQNLENN